MNEHTTTPCLLFPELASKPVVVAFDQEHASSDGGAVLLKAADDRLSLTATLAACLRDDRQAGKITHELRDLIGQRIFGLACGYADANDAARLANDPIHKLLLGRNPIDGDALASQPTLCRFENSVGPLTSYRLGSALADLVIERHRRRLGGKARRITVDLDPTDDPTHGGQQLSLFNGYYDTWCYLPILGFLTFDDEPEEHLFTAVLRPGNAPARLGAIAILRRILDRLREAFPGARFLVRLDGGFACPEVLDFLDEQPGLNYIVAIAENAVPKRRSAKLMRKARKRSRKTGKTANLFGDCRYAARKRWPHKRRVVIKAEVVRLEGRTPRDNARYVVTNLRCSPQRVYATYRDRGDVENRIKELHHGLEIDRTSCTRFWANQFRVLMTAAAYVLMQEIRLAAKRTASARAQVSTLRERLIKLGAHVVVSVRRIVLHLPASFPFMDEWNRVARVLGAQTG